MNDTKLTLNDAHLGPIWYLSEPSDVPYCPNQFLSWDLFLAVSYSKPALINACLVLIIFEELQVDNRLYKLLVLQRWLRFN